MGRLLRLLAAPAVAPALAWDAASQQLPAGFAHMHNTANSTYRDAAGRLQLAAANAPRWNHDVNGTFLGLRIEGARTNLFAQANATPADATGFATTGTASISLVPDAAALAAATCKLDAVVTGSVFEASGGASGGTVVWPGQTGSTLACSFSCWARITAGASCTLTHNGTSPGSVTISGGAYQRFALENQAISATTVQPLLDLPAGVTVRFILCQTEVGGHASSEIRTQGASAARPNTSLADLSIAAEPWWNPAQGAIVVEVDFDTLSALPVMTPFFLGAGGQNFTNAIGMATLAFATRRKTLSRYYAGTTQQYTADVGSVDAARQPYAFATSWADGVQATAASGAASYETFPAGPVAGIDRLYLGGRATSDFLFGHLKTLKAYKQTRTPAQLGRDLVKAGQRVVHTCGQSNMTGWFAATSGSNNAGEIAAKTLYDQFYPATRNWVANGGTVATSVIHYPGTSTAANWWLKPATGELGVPFVRWLDVAQGCGNAACDALVDTSGESDAGNCTVAEFKAAQLQKWGVMRGYVGPVPVVQVPIGRNTASLNGYQTIRQAQWELARENAWVHLAPERFDLALSDAIHMTDAANGTCGRRTFRKLMAVLGQAVTGGVDGPAFGPPARSGTTLDVPVAHDGGADFTIGSSGTGFRYFNGADFTAAENAITAAVRVNATLARLTLTTGSGGTLYFGLGSAHNVTLANVPRDDSAEQLPFRTGVWAVA